MALPPPTNTPLGMDEKTTCVLTWGLSIFFPIVVPLVVFLVCSNNPWARRQGALALSLHVVAAIIVCILAITVVGLLLAPVVWAVVLAFCIWGAVESSNGRDFSPPLISDLTKSIFKI